jgi:hypothetical protein
MRSMSCCIMWLLTVSDLQTTAKKQIQRSFALTKGHAYAC